MDVSLSVGLGARETERLCGLVADGISIEAAVSQVRDRSPALGTAAAAQRDTPRPAPGETREPRSPLPQDAETQRLFEALLQTPVQITRGGGAIRLTITVYTDEQLKDIYERLGGDGEG